MQKVMKQYIILIIGLLVMGIGIAMVTQAELGTTPITSISYVLSFIFPLTIGQFTTFLTLLFVLVQVIILGKDFPKFQYLQLLIGPVLGYFIDLGMLIFTYYHPSLYIEKLILLIIGCIMIALGVILQLVANTIFNPADGIIKVISMKYKLNFGRVKIAFDSLQVIIAALISFWAFGDIQGIREGTIISAFLVGFFINRIRKIQQILLKKRQHFR
ncbi:YczE/YyaS/YitT family protein [Pullulanibacillus camelliae]|uniref:YczE/YyaS/YitT family protein n=1 Tax=Pullulanibacillus camelliae TaxID=1707096 RepID=UPI003570B15D